MAPIYSLFSPSSCNAVSIFSSDGVSTRRSHLNPPTTAAASSIYSSGRFIWQRCKCKNQNAGDCYSRDGRESKGVGGEQSATGRREAMVEMTIAVLTIPALASNAAPLGEASEPQQVHISMVGRDHIRVTWITDDKQVQSTVEYGKESARYDFKATGEHTSYKFLSYSSGKIHHVKIGPLEPDTTYYYKCGGHSPEFSFKTTPSSFPIEFAVVGDLGQTEWTKSTLERTNSSNYDMFLLPGDLSYADGKQQRWDSFGRLVEPYASQRPWMVTAGNHEIESIPFVNPQGFTAYNSRWLMPYEESGSSSNLYYSFEVAACHIIMLGSYADFEAGSDQYKWLVADLTNVDRKRTPWLIVLVHAPWYNTNHAHQGDGESMRRAMEELLYNARVDVVFAGHVHAYERFTRIYDNRADQDGPVYITIGDGGNHEGLALTFMSPASPLSLYREASFGHGRLRIVDERRACWTWHRNDDSDSQVADEVWLNNLALNMNGNGGVSPSFCDEL